MASAATAADANASKTHPCTAAARSMGKRRAKRATGEALPGATVAWLLRGAESLANVVARTLRRDETSSHERDDALEGNLLPGACSWPPSANAS